MEGQHNTDEDKSRQAWENYEDDAHRVYSEPIAEQGRVLAAADEDHDAHRDGGDDQQHQRNQECIEVSMVSFAHARSDPGAVMIHSLHADPTLVTVAGPVRPVDVARTAELKTHCHLPDHTDVGHDHIVANVIALGDRHEILINFVPVFLLKQQHTIF